MIGARILHTSHRFARTARLLDAPPFRHKVHKHPALWIGSAAALFGAGCASFLRSDSTSPSPAAPHPQPYPPSAPARCNDLADVRIAGPPTSPSPLPTAVPILLLLRVLGGRSSALDCSPMYNGVPVATTFLMTQALPHFAGKFPGLEMSAFFAWDPPKIFRKDQETESPPSPAPSGAGAGAPAPAPAPVDGQQEEKRTRVVSDVFSLAPDFANEYAYAESGLVASVWPTAARTEVPVFERLSAVEEANLGQAGIRKKPVGKLVMIGSCTYGCAQVKLRVLQVYSLKGDLIWEKKV
ncbi:hypothetical protein DFJ73DRAFT_806936 [Zopfochytrium polystomum]|nr:hypothetical protein DFJ73DRAFT_806936 [Zopfochytrium polystomum]